MERSSSRKCWRASVVKRESSLMVGQASRPVCLGSKNHPRGARTPACKVGQTIAFCGLSSLTTGRLVDRRQKTIVCPTWSSVLCEISRGEAHPDRGKNRLEIGTPALSQQT